MLYVPPTAAALQDGGRLGDVVLPPWANGSGVGVGAAALPTFGCCTRGTELQTDKCNAMGMLPPPPLLCTARVLPAPIPPCPAPPCPACPAAADEFVRVMREALESDHVSRNLHHWIDLIFGCKQRGEAGSGVRLAGAG